MGSPSVTSGPPSALPTAPTAPTQGPGDIGGIPPPTNAEAKRYIQEALSRPMGLVGRAAEVLGLKGDNLRNISVDGNNIRIPFTPSQLRHDGVITPQDAQRVENAQRVIDRVLGNLPLMRDNLNVRFVETRRI